MRIRPESRVGMVWIVHLALLVDVETPSTPRVCALAGNVSPIADVRRRVVVDQVVGKVRLANRPRPIQFVDAVACNDLSHAISEKTRGVEFSQPGVDERVAEACR